jgi:hypothetical protein
MTQDPIFLVSINLFAAVLARSLKRNLLTAVLLTVVVIACGGYLVAHHGSEVLETARQVRDNVLSWTGPD